MIDLKQATAELQPKRIAVLMGGPGSEHPVSIASGRAVLAALQSAGLNAFAVEMRNPPLELPPHTDLVFNTIHGTYGEDGSLQAELDALGIPYTGANAAASRLAFDKIASKRAFLAAQLPTPAFATFSDIESTDLEAIPLPYVIKPPREGSSVGVHIIHDLQTARDALADMRQFNSEILIEAFVAGKELTVGILNDNPLPIIHIAPKSGFYDMANKYPWLDQTGSTDYYCPADLPAAVTTEVQSIALNAHRSLNIASYSRVDLLLDQNHQAWVLEINTIPGMTASSLLPKAAAAAGVSFQNLCIQVAYQAFHK